MKKAGSVYKHPLIKYFYLNMSSRITDTLLDTVLKVSTVFNAVNTFCSGCVYFPNYYVTFCYKSVKMAEKYLKFGSD